MPSRKKRDADSAAPTFEETLGELEEIIEGIESSESGLEESITSYAKGVELLARCREMLRSAELKVEELTRQLRPAASDSAQPADEQSKGGD